MSIEKEIERAVKRTIALDKDTPYKSAAEQEKIISDIKSAFNDATFHFENSKSLMLNQSGKKRLVKQYDNLYSPENILCQSIKQILDRAFKIKYPNRNKTTRTLFSVLSAAIQMSDFTIVKFDFKDYFNSVSSIYVFEKYLKYKLDYILTDLLPVEISELFSFSQLYTFLLKKENQKILDALIQEIKQNKAQSSSRMFENGWSTKPLKYKILKGTDTMREMSVIQPFSALNLFLFIECYQKEILNYFEKHHDYSIRYHKKSTDLYYKAKSGRVTQYFQDQSFRAGHGAIQQAGNYFKIGPFESINSFADSRVWRMCNFKYYQKKLKILSKGKYSEYQIKNR